MRLNEAKMNETITINRLTGLDPLVKRRLKELGVTEGNSVKVVRYCPLGGPCMLECKGQLIGLRRKDTCCIEGEVSS